MPTHPPAKVRFKNVIDRAEAVEFLRDWWRDGPKARGLEKFGTVTACTAYYVPFWSTEWEATIYLDIPLEDAFRRSPVKAVFEQHRTRTDVACDSGEFEVSFLPALRGETVPEMTGVIRELDVTVPEDESVARQREIVEETILKAFDEKHSSSPKRVHTRLLERTLVLYPLWVARYTYRGRPYQATIDGVTGEVLAGRAPGDLLTRCCTGAGVFLVCAVGAAIWLRILFTLGWIGVLMIGSVVVLFCLGIVWWKYSFLRYGSVVVTGQAAGGYRYCSKIKIPAPEGEKS